MPFGGGFGNAVAGAAGLAPPPSTPDPAAAPTQVFNAATGQLDPVTSDMTGLLGPNPAPALLQAFNDINQAYRGRQQDPTTLISDLYMEFLNRPASASEVAAQAAWMAKPGVGLSGLSNALRDLGARQGITQNREWDPTGLAGIGQAQLAGVNLQAWQQTVSSAEAWASQVGWKYFPSMVELYQAYQQGVYSDPQQAAAFFSQRSLTPDTLSQTPWAQTGDTAQQWRDRQNSFLDAMQTYTGTRDPFNDHLFNQAMSEKWSTQRLTNTLLNDPTFQNQYGWTKYGMTYQSFQQYKTQNRQQIITRYGSDAAGSDTAYLSDLGNPLQSVHASAGPTAVGQSLQQHNVGMSQVR